MRVNRSAELSQEEHQTLEEAVSEATRVLEESVEREGEEARRGVRDVAQTVVHTYEEQGHRAVVVRAQVDDEQEFVVVITDAAKRLPTGKWAVPGVIVRIVEGEEDDPEGSIRVELDPVMVEVGCLNEIGVLSGWGGGHRGGRARGMGWPGGSVVVVVRDEVMPDRSGDGGQPFPPGKWPPYDYRQDKDARWDYRLVGELASVLRRSTMGLSRLWEAGTWRGIPLADALAVILTDYMPDAHVSPEMPDMFLGLPDDIAEAFMLNPGVTELHLIDAISAALSRPDRRSLYRHMGLRNLAGAMLLSRRLRYATYMPAE